MLNIQKDIPLAQYTTFKIGGPAKFFVEVKSKEDMIEAVEYARENNLEVFILGGGSNLLISDKGFDGIVIRVKNLELRVKDKVVECGAGTNLSKIVSESVANNLAGLEWAAGIPGTVGGAVIGNAGAFGGEIKDNLEEIVVYDIERNEERVLRNDECQFSYRSSIFKDNPEKFIMISVKFKLKDGNEDGNDKIKEIVWKRNNKQPKYPSSGSFFKNPIVEDEKIIENFEKDTGVKIKDEKVPAGWFVEELGLRGKKIGGAQISEKHANFIVNTGGARAEDVIILSSLIKQKAREKFGIQLKEEIRMIGF